MIMQDPGNNPGPSVSLEQMLYKHGDNLYRLALLLSKDEQQAVQALEATADAAVQNPPEPFGVDALVALLVTTIRQHAHTASQPVYTRWLNRLPFRRAANKPTTDRLYDAIRTLPFEQRQVLGLHLLMGYDIDHITQMSDATEEQVRTWYTEALRALAPLADMVVPDDRPAEICSTVQHTLMHATPDQARGDPTLRGHLAICTACRAFERTWNSLTQRVEEALRGNLREHTLPPELLERLIENKRPIHPLLRHPLVRLAFIPALVLLLIGLFVVPGFFQRPALSSEDPAVAVDSRALVEQALANYLTVPEQQGVWHARWEILWYFTNGRAAPLLGEVWIDAQQPARHRIQLTHQDGGAPYELQLGDGSEQLWYALHPAYYPSLYSRENQRVTTQLLQQIMREEDQATAQTARLGTGAWDVGRAYLRQAAQATDLHALGQRYDGEQTIQLLSFSGISPLDEPPDTPDDSEQQITILLAIDLADGRLRSVTELRGAGSEQASRITWRLRSEGWLNDDAQIRTAFDIDAAWTGHGRFEPARRTASADSTLLLFELDEVATIDELFIFNDLWFPTEAPPGSEQALFRLRNTDNLMTLIYRGPGRWMHLLLSDTPLTFGADLDLDTTIASAATDDAIEVGDWTVELEMSKGQRLWASAQREITTDDIMTSPGPELVRIDASGYSREEVLQVLRNLQPFDFQSLQAQDHLFALDDNVDRAARDALIDLLVNNTAPDEDQVVHVREQVYARHDPTANTLLDPYRPPRYSGRSETMMRERWSHVTHSSSILFNREIYDDIPIDNISYVDQQRAWVYQSDIDLLRIWPYEQTISPRWAWATSVEKAAMAMLGNPGAGMSLVEQPDGTNVVTQQESLAEYNRRSPYDQYLQPTAMTTELVLPAEQDKPVTMRVRVVPEDIATHGESVVIYEVQVLTDDIVSVAEAPEVFRDSTPPEAQIVVDHSNYGSPITLPDEMLAQSITPFRFPANSPLNLRTVNEEITRSGILQRGPYLEQNIPENLAQVFDYRDQSDESNQLLLFQGQVDGLSMYFRSDIWTPWVRPIWEESEPTRVRIAGREVDAWLMRTEYHTATHYWLFAELDGILLIAGGYDTWFLETALPLLDTLQPADEG